MRLVDMLPEKDEQAFITGKKKSGKSTLVRKMILELPDNEIIVVLDTKREWKVKPFMTLGNKRVHHLRFTNIRLVRSPGIYIYQSKYPHFYDAGITRILLSAYNRKNVTIVIHEVYHLCHGSNPVPALGQAIAQGRAHNLRLFLESQRPSNCPVMSYTDADIFIEFLLQNPDDRKRMADNSGFPELAIPVEAKHDFWVAKNGWDNAKYIQNTRDDDSDWDIFKMKSKKNDTRNTPTP
jgi:hypothetical protein